MLDFEIISIKKALEKTHKQSYFKPLSVSRGVAQWLARLLWEQDVAGSTPATPTIFCKKMVNEDTSLLFTRRQPLFTQKRSFSSHLHPIPEDLLVKSFHYATAQFHL